MRRQLGNSGNQIDSYGLLNSCYFVTPLARDSYAARLRSQMMRSPCNVRSGSTR